MYYLGTVYKRNLSMWYDGVLTVLLKKKFLIYTNRMITILKVHITNKIAPKSLADIKNSTKLLNILSKFSL